MTDTLCTMAGAEAVGAAHAERSVLVVDDNQQCLIAIKRQARGRAHVIVAVNAAQALELARRERPEIALIDYFLGTTNGLSLIDPLRQINPTMEILVASGAFTAELAERAVRAGANGVLDKPFDLAYALRRVDEGPAAIERPEEIRSLDQVENAYITRVLIACSFNVSRASKFLGIQPNTLRARIARAGIPRSG